MRIFQHTGMGDYIICNGLIRELISDGKQHTLLVNEQQETSVRFMYRDISNISFEIMDFSEIWTKPWKSENALNSVGTIIGLQYLERFVNTTYHFDEVFYLQFNVPFDYRWSKFKVNRNLESEHNLFNQMNLVENQYIFLHDRPPWLINKSHLSTDLPIISPSWDVNNIFDYCYIIENANEIHCIDSSFKNLVDSLNPHTNQLYYHLNRQNNPFYYSSSKLGWKTVNYIV